MKKFNDTVLAVTIAIIDFLYRDLPIQRFWVLETIARALPMVLLLPACFKVTVASSPTCSI